MENALQVYMLTKFAEVQPNKAQLTRMWHSAIAAHGYVGLMAKMQEMRLMCYVWLKNKPTDSVLLSKFAQAQKNWLRFSEDRDRLIRDAMMQRPGGVMEFVLVSTEEIDWLIAILKQKLGQTK